MISPLHALGAGSFKETRPFRKTVQTDRRCRLMAGEGDSTTGRET